jgi:hypothetical protein
MSNSAEGIVENAVTWTGRVRKTEKSWVDLTGTIGFDFVAAPYSGEKSKSRRPLGKLVVLKEAHNGT